MAVAQNPFDQVTEQLVVIDVQHVRVNAVFGLGALIRGGTGHSHRAPPSCGVERDHALIGRLVVGEEDARARRRGSPWQRRVWTDRLLGPAECPENGGP